MKFLLMAILFVNGEAINSNIEVFDSEEACNQATDATFKFGESVQSLQKACISFLSYCAPIKDEQ